MLTVNEIDSKRFYKNLQHCYQGKRVLILGADGFLGTNCIYRLKQLGAHISVLSRRPQSAISDRVHKSFHGDLAISNVAETVVKDQDIIFDFVGSTGAVQSNIDPFINLEVECLPHLNIFKACAAHNPAAMIMFCSTRLVYGKPQYLPVDETHPINPESFYAVHKITLENYLKVFATTHGQVYCIMRLSNPYGANMSLTQNGYSIINLFMRKALGGETINIYGDGEQRRDYIHIDDTLNAFLACAINKKCIGETFNLGGSTSVSLREAVKVISEKAGNTPVQTIPWPSNQKVVETGDYQTDLTKLHQTVSLPGQISVTSGLAQTMESYLSSCNKERIYDVCQ